ASRAAMTLRRLARGTGWSLLAIAMLAVGAWCALAVWYQCRAGPPVCGMVAGGVAALGLAAAVGLAGRRRRLVAGSYAAAVAAFLAWWATITPSHDRRWAPDVAHGVTASIEADRAVVSNVRNFAWRSETDFDPVWEQRTYRLSHLTDVDLILSYWMGEAIAHTIVSFGFDDAPRLAFSIEIRKESHEEFSSLAGLFKRYELVIIA